VNRLPQHFHFLGICGTAMASVAAALCERGCTVTGSDEKIYPPMSDFLRARGIPVREPYRAENLPNDAEIVVIGNAIKRGNREVEAVLNRKLYYLSLPEVLKEFFLRGRHNLVVAGTHGKTTTSALLTWMLTVGELEPGYVVGGLPRLFPDVPKAGRWPRDTGRSRGAGAPSPHRPWRSSRRPARCT
jgi:UDP-N-acetylmuramate: L-alanyl-gamma-D-glutamyl-meso-diaminopimelate ligase